ncbi:MAG: hypothetical protein AABZ12_12065 [Planctomycetota bacterium]
MPISDDDRDRIEAFRVFVEDATAGDDRYGEPSRDDRDDGSMLATRFAVAPNCWLEVGLGPMIPQVRVGVVTTDRWKSEEMEELIESSGDSMEEFVGAGMSEVGLDWEAPPVEHYREAGQYFYFATPLKLDELRDLESDAVRDKTLRMLEGYMIAFGPILAVEGPDE